jgi:predicted cupin superfamily sugar epimerase
MPLCPRARTLIRRLQLQPHPEGGYYAEVYRAHGRVGTRRGQRAAATSIYFLLPRGHKSLLHRVRSDELWHYYEGAPLRLIEVDPQLSRGRVHRLGPERGATRQVLTIAADHWQAAETTGDYTLVGCTVAPGFEFVDFTLLKDAPAARNKLQRALPALRKFVE